METIPEFDIYTVGVSGGKDSTAALLWMWYESGIPREKIIGTFDDTQNEDPLTYAWLDLLRGLGIPIITIATEGFFELAKRMKRFPRQNVRFCTRELKVKPSRAYILALLRDGKNPCSVSGSRKQEGRKGVNNRAELPEFDPLDLGWGCAVWRPLNAWKIEDVWKIHNKYILLEGVQSLVWNDPTMPFERKAELVQRIETNGIPRNPLYDMGSSRVGCFPCMNSRKLEVRAVDYWRPERVAEIEAWENDPSFAGIGSFLGSNVPVRMRSKFVTNPKKTKSYKIATIRDVVRWSWTGKRAETDSRQQITMDIFDEPVSSCDIGGMCE